MPSPNVRWANTLVKVLQVRRIMDIPPHVQNDLPEYINAGTTAGIQNGIHRQGHQSLLHRIDDIPIHLPLRF